MRLGFTLAALIVGAAARPAAPITSGRPDAGDPAVVALEPVQCSGTLITARVVLTAAHCLWGRRPTQITAFFGPDVRGPGRRIGVIDGRVHPDWQPATQENDLAVLLLAEPVQDVTPVAVMRVPVDDALLGAPLRLVGFGSAGARDPSSAGRKRAGRSTLAAYLATTIVDAGAPSNTCAGDSGGPAFLTIHGTEYLAAVTSRGDAGCRRFGVRTRVDPYLGSFVQPYVEGTEPAAAHTGDRCAYPEQCDTGSCRMARDSPESRFCSAHCERDAECPARMACRDGFCTHDAPSPGSFGSPCDRDADCVGWLCASAALGGERACAVSCVPAAPRPCPPGFTCTTAARRPGESVCLPGRPGR